MCAASSTDNYHTLPLPGEALGQNRVPGVLNLQIPRPQTLADLCAEYIMPDIPTSANSPDYLYHLQLEEYFRLWNRTHNRLAQVGDSYLEVSWECTLCAVSYTHLPLPTNREV